MKYVKKIFYKPLRVDVEVLSIHYITMQEIQKGELNMCEQELPTTAHILYQYMKAQSNELNELDTTIALLSLGIDKSYETTRKYLNILIDAGYITSVPYQLQNKTRYIIERR